MFNNGTFTTPEYERYRYTRSEAAVTYCPNVGTLVIGGDGYSTNTYILTQPQAWGDNENTVSLGSPKAGNCKESVATTFKNRVYVSCGQSFDEEYRIETIDFSEVTNAEEDSDFFEYVFIVFP